MSERVYGVTPPISTTLPTEEEKRLNRALHDELRVQGTFESRAETDKRREVLERLEKITTVFVQRAAKDKHPKNAILIRDAIGRVFTYGSYRLGVYGPGSDIDTLVVAPKYVTAEHYFDIFPGLLLEMAPPGAITDLTAVPDAFVPIIKFEFFGISIDLIFCSIQSLNQLPTEKTWSLADNNLLRGLSENEVRSVNGTRVTDEILHLVPEPATFKLALRAIKLWAQRRAVYANIMGYPGGVAWAMMVARVCQLYPKATSAVIVNKFFNLMFKWPWPLPVLLKDIDYACTVARAPVWNPKLYTSDRNHKMPVITPSYPSMCATHNIGKSSMTVIKQELKRGAQLTEEIMVGRRPWKDLFTKHTFFTQDFKYYLTVTAASRTKKMQNAWSGLIESKVRLLVNKLEQHYAIALARPFNKGYDREHRCKDNAQLDDVVYAGSLAYLYKPPADGDDKVKAELKTEAKPPIKTEDGVSVKQDPDGEGQRAPASIIKPEPGEDGVETKLDDIPEAKQDVKQEAEQDAKQDQPKEMEIYTTNYYIGLQLYEGNKQLDLSREVNDWRGLCTAHDLYDEGLVFLSIKNLKATQLPDDVFEPGEARPRPVKKTLKRPASEEPSRQQQPPVKRQVLEGKGVRAPPPPPPAQQQQQQQKPASAAATAAAG